MSASMEKRLVIVGLGRVGLGYIEALSQFPEVRLEAVISSDTGRARKRLGEGVRVFASVTEMLAAHCVPHIAIIASPPSTHLDVARPLLMANIDVLVEPPIATTPADADLIAALAERLGRVACTASRFRTHAALNEVERRISAARIGRLCQIEVTLSSKRDASASWYGNPELSGGGAWMEHGSDAIDIAERLAGPIHSIRMLRASHVQGAEVEDEAIVETEHEHGLCTRIDVSWNEQLAGPVVRCIGDKGEIVLGNAQASLRSIDGYEEAFGPGYLESEGTEEVLSYFMRSRMSPELQNDHGAQSFAWLHAAYRSLASKRWEIA